jgi:hypothetical protein
VTSWTLPYRAAVALGAASAASTVFMTIGGDFQFVRMRGAAAVVAVVLGLAAVAAGVLRSRLLMTATGAAFLAAAGTQLAFLAQGDRGFLDGDGSTFALWLGLGAALVAVGAAGAETTNDLE